MWFLLFLDKSPKKENIKDVFHIHVKRKRTGNKLVSLSQACWESYKYIYNCLEMVTALLYRTRQGQNCKHNSMKIETFY